MVANVSQSAATATARPAPQGKAVRMLGRYQLMRLLGKSAQTMLWLAQDSRGDAEVMLAMPRVQPPDPDALGAWIARVRRTSRLKHPRIAPLLDVGDHERWPYAVYERGAFVTRAEKVSPKGMPAQQLTEWSVQVLQGLAFAHEAGSAHCDLQPYSLLVDDGGNVRLLGLDIVDMQSFSQFRSDPGGHEAAMDERRQQRQAAEIDVLAFGLLMHQVLAGVAPLDEPDVARVVGRLPPFGHEMVRLPWTVPMPIPEPLRAIVNRSTDRQERQRYRNARTFERALEGWLQASSDKDGGPITLLLGRMRSVGLLPAMPGGADRAARLAVMADGHTSELSEVVLQDFALAFETIRTVNLAQSQAGHSGSGVVLAIRRAIAMIGLDGVRHAALSLRPWPGPLNEDAAAALGALIRRVKRAGAVARAAARGLRPGGRRPDHGLAEPRLARRAVPLPGRGDADPPPDATDRRREGRRAGRAGHDGGRRVVRGAGRRHRCARRRRDAPLGPGRQRAAHGAARAADRADPYAVVRRRHAAARRELRQRRARRREPDRRQVDGRGVARRAALRARAEHQPEGHPGRAGAPGGRVRSGRFMTGRPDFAAVRARDARAPGAGASERGGESAETMR